MGLDIRIPIGLTFITLGVLLGGYGLVSDKAIYAKSLDINVNLIWGIVMLAFGLVTFAMGKKGTAAMKPADGSAEGGAIERMEHESGREKNGTP